MIKKIHNYNDKQSKLWYILQNIILSKYHSITWYKKM